MRYILVLAIMLGSAIAIQAQTAGAVSKLFWDQPAPDLATAQGYTYAHYDDGSSSGVDFTGVTCAAKVPAVAQLFDCSVAFPAFTPGQHTVTITAKNVAGESPKSAVFTFTFVVVPGTPTNLRIGK